MSEQEQGQGETKQRGGRRKQAEQQPQRGATTIQNPVVSRVAGIAAQEIEGIRMGGAGAQTASGILGAVTGGSSGQNRGVYTEVGEEEAAVDLTLTVEYGRSVAQIAQAVRQNVINRLEDLTGLRAAEVNVDVVDIYFPQQQEAQSQLEQGQQRAG